MIGRDTIDRIRSRVDIVAVVSETVKLQQKGRSWSGLCPFHQEKSPSFTVSQERGLFHCFGCKTSGDVFKFVELTEGLSFIEVVKKLAERAGVEIEDERPDHDRAADQRARKAKEELYGINAHASAYFTQMLHDHPLSAQAREELERRGLPVSGPIVDAFGIGYAPHGWDGLSTHLSKLGISPAQAEQVGLLAPRSTGSGFYDAFRHRLMVAIRDAQGRIVAFSGRVLPPPPGVEDTKNTAPPKYVNSRESPIYSKSQTLFGLFQARNGIRAAHEAVIVEGNFDLVAMHARGIDNVVAPMGTAFTEEQARLLKRFTQNLVLLFDADSAGRKATWAARESCKQAGLVVRAARLESGKDPDDFLRAKGAEAMRAVLQNARSLDEVLVRDALDAASTSSDLSVKKRALDAVKPLLAEQEPSFRESLIQQVAKGLGLDPSVLFRSLRGDFEAVPERSSRSMREGSGEEERLSKAIAEALFSCPDVLDEPDVQDCLALVTGEWTFAIAALGEELRTAREERRPLDAAALLARVPESTRGLVAESLVSTEDPAIVRRIVRKQRVLLENLAAEARYKDLVREIERAESQGDHDRAMSLMLEKFNTERALRRAREQAAKEN